MNKLKITLIVLFIVGIIISVTLILLSLSRIDVGQIGLSIDNIVSNYTSTDVYGPGLHFIGISRSFIKVKQIPTAINMNVTTYTTDYYKMNAKIIGTYQLSYPNDFGNVSQFYTNFGNNPQVLIQSIMQKKIISILSHSSSLFYKNSNSTILLQNDLTSAINNVFTANLGTQLDFTILIQSLIIQNAASSSIQSLTRQIEHAQRQFVRADTQKISLSNFIQNYEIKTDLELLMVESMINQRIDMISSLVQLYGPSFPVIAKSLFGNQIMQENLSFASSQLGLRPQLYILNKANPF